MYIDKDAIIICTNLSRQQEKGVGDIDCQGNGQLGSSGAVTSAGAGAFD